MPTAGEQIGETIVRLSQENADLSREVERLKAHESHIVRATLDLKAKLEAEIKRLCEENDQLESEVKRYEAAEKARDA